MVPKIAAALSRSKATDTCCMTKVCDCVLWVTAKIWLPMSTKGQEHLYPWLQLSIQQYHNKMVSLHGTVQGTLTSSSSLLILQLLSLPWWLGIGVKQQRCLHKWHPK